MIVECYGPISQINEKLRDDIYSISELCLPPLFARHILHGRIFLEVPYEPVENRLALFYGKSPKSRKSPKFRKSRKSRKSRRSLKKFKKR